MDFPTRRTAVLTAHFGDPAWVTLLVERVRWAFPQLADEQIHVIDQDRTPTSAGLLRERLGNVTVLRYPRSEPHFAAVGHDHAHVLNLAVREIDCDHLILFDSDAHPTSRELAGRIAEGLLGNDALLATRANGWESLPCFMVFGPRVDRTGLLFDEGQLEEGVDTGRRIFTQVAAMGLDPLPLRGSSAFGTRWGSFYLDGAVYHHRSASFAASSDPRLQAKFRHWRRESDFFDRRVLSGRYELGRIEQLHVRALAARRRAPYEARQVARRLLGDRVLERLKRLRR